MKDKTSQNRRQGAGKGERVAVEFCGFAVRALEADVAG